MKEFATLFSLNFKRVIEFFLKLEKYSLCAITTEPWLITAVVKASPTHKQGNFEAIIGQAKSLRVNVLLLLLRWRSFILLILLKCAKTVC